ncbi:unnamed protein product [Calypogeia fissa]
MSSLLAYGSGFLSEDIWSGAGLSEPWAQSFGFGDGGGDSSSISVGDDGESSGSQSSASGGGGLSQFFSVIQAATPKGALNSPGVLSRASTKKELHWDSPPLSPSTVFVHLPNSVLSLIATGTKADAVVVSIFQHGSDSVVETLLYLPKRLCFADLVTFKPDLLSCVNGKVCSTELLDLPLEFSNALKHRPESFLGLRFSWEKYSGIIFGLWCDGTIVPATTEKVFADAVLSLPVLLSNRINARKYDRPGIRFDAMMKVTSDSVLFVDDERAQTYVNHAAASLLGLPNQGEVEPSKVAIAMRALTERCSSRTDPQHWMRLVSTDLEVEIEEDWELANPRRVLHVRSYPVTARAAHGRLWIYSDVTSERDAEVAIEAANKAKSQFLAMMSHELRTPMTGVLGMLDLLRMTNLEAEQQGLLHIMQESAYGLMEVINNILDFCKIEAGRLQLEEIDFSLGDMFEQIQSMVKTSFLKKELKMTISGEPSGRNIVRGDPVRLRQVLLNIISNAIKFTENGSIDVSWRFLGPQWVDTTVVAMSQAYAGKSKLINQIINASRGEKCSVEQSTSPTGRSVIVVNCSSAGAAGPYLEPPFSNTTHPPPSAPSPLSLQSQPEVTSATGNRTKELPSLSTSFPVMYSLGPEKKPIPEVFKNGDTRHRFIDRKSLVEMDPPQRTPSYSDSEQAARRTQSDELPTPTPTPTPFSEKPLVKDPTSGSNETEFRASKYQRVPLERSGNLQSRNSLVDQSLHPEGIGIDSIPHWRIAMDSPSPNNPLQPNNGRVPILRAESLTPRSREIIELMTQNKPVPVLRPHVCTGNHSLSEAEAKAETSSAMEEANTAGPTSGPKFCKICKGVLYDGAMGTRPEDRVWLEVTISDTGVGIGKEQLGRLFVGSQAGSQRINASGAGLGLAICKGLLCLMNGKIQMDSKIGEGTTVVVTVPLLPAEDDVQELVESVSQNESTSAAGESIRTGVQKTAAVPEPECSKPVVAEAKKETKTEPTKTEAKRPETKATGSESKEKIKVLVAEDNRVNQLLIRKMFQHFGHQAEIVGNGKLAVEAVQRTTFDLVLMDVQMPILDGLSATKAIRALSPPASQVPIYALSADTPGSGPLEETGLDGYLKKPINWDMMSQLISQIQAAKDEL